MTTITKFIAFFFLVALAPIHGVIGTAFFLVMVDLISGIWAAMKRGETINSSGMRRTVSKLCVYQFTIIGCYLTETYMLNGLVPIVKLASSCIGLVELKSILENANTITGTDLFKALLKQLGSDNDK